MKKVAKVSAMGRFALAAAGRVRGIETTISDVSSEPSDPHFDHDVTALVELPSASPGDCFHYTQKRRSRVDD